METSGGPRRYVALLTAILLLASSCGGGSSDDDVAVAEAEPTRTTEAANTDDPTPQPDPTVAPTAPPAATATPEPDPEPTAEPEPANGTNFDAVTGAVEAFVADRGLNGAGLIIVHRDDGVIYHEHFGDFSEDRVSLIASSSKMISAGVLLKLHEQGTLDIDAPIASYLDWENIPAEVTVAQLISNSSGLVGLGPDLLYAPYICQWLPTFELEACGQTVLGSTDDDADTISPDTEFRYGGAQWQVAGAVAEAVSGKTWGELIAEIYVEPCGVNSLGYISLGSVVTGDPGYPVAFAGDPDALDPTENPNIEGGAYVTTADYGELLLMHLRGGACGTNQVLSQESLDTMHADRISEAYGGDAFGSGYGMGWWIDRTTGRISDGGAFGTVPWLDLDDGYGAYLVIEDTSDTGQELHGEIEDLVHEAVTG